MPMKVKFWGVRGSLPTAPSPLQRIQAIEEIFQTFFASGYTSSSQINDFILQSNIPDLGGYGTATTCAELRSASGAHIIIDGGTGIRRISDHMIKTQSVMKRSPIHILMTHFHWDHILGLNFFAPLFFKDVKIHFYAVQDDLESAIQHVFKKPYFPVEFKELQSEIHFHKLEPRKKIKIEDFEVTPYQLDHPDPCWGYKISNGGSHYAHCVDTEGIRIDRASLGPDLPLYQDIDLMYFDAQYTLPELAEKSNWGHSASQIGLEIALREGIKNVIFGHHDPGAGNKQIEKIRQQTAEFHNWKIKQAETNHMKVPEVNWSFAYEGLEIDL
jgi:phosphoribosyl 1,2-cyclic phosphodiesterase